MLWNGHAFSSARPSVNRIELIQLEIELGFNFVVAMVS